MITRSGFDVFFSYNALDHVAVDCIAKALEKRGLSVFIDRWELIPGQPWPEALEQNLIHCRSVVVVLGPSGMGRWQQREYTLAIDRQAQDSAFGVIPVLLPGAEPGLGFLKLNTWVDLRGGIDNNESIDLLSVAVRGQPPKSLLDKSQLAISSVCPYRGLEVFREEDASFFFGREEFIKRIRVAIAEQSLLAVVGPSGSGKSSVIRAGLIPGLRRAESGTVWEVITLIPGDRPLYSLSRVLLPLLEPDMSERERLVEIQAMEDDLAQGRLALRGIVERILDKQQGTDRVLLFVDQWEELYFGCYEKRDKDAKQYKGGKHARSVQRFIEELLAGSEEGPLSVVLTLRADFYAEVLTNRKLVDRFHGSVFNLGPMTREELERAVVKPAQKTGLEFDTGLVDRLLDDVGSEPGNLPLLEFVLKELWLKRIQNHLLYQSYKAIGGIKGAVAQRAESLYQALDRSRRNTAERVFTRLVRPGRETGDTRRRADLEEFDAQEQALIRYLAGPDARILITGRDAGTKQETIEVAHEAVIREWKRLQDWVDKVRSRLKSQAVMEEMAYGWEEYGGGLASGRQLREFQRVGATSNQTVRFLKASRWRKYKVWGALVIWVALLLGSADRFLIWIEDLGISPYKGVELLLYRAGIHYPTWIPEMITLNPGSFLMGSPDKNRSDADPDANPDEFPQHRVTVNGFRIGKYEVTVENFCASSKRRCPNSVERNSGHAAADVPWRDAISYAQWLTKATGQKWRLPTEAEWEYAARAGTQGRFWWCADRKPNCDIVPDMANCTGCDSTKKDKDEDEYAQRIRIGSTLPVGSFPANAFGLYDTAGNVWEWTSSQYRAYPYRDDDGREHLEFGREPVMRGGSWMNSPEDMRSANRFKAIYYADSPNSGIGLRIAQDL